MTFEEVKEMFKKSIDATDTMNQALENLIQSIYLKGYGDAISEIEKLRAEIETKYGQCDICEYFEDYDYEENDISEYKPIGNVADILQIIDKYKTSPTEQGVE